MILASVDIPGMSLNQRPGESWVHFIFRMVTSGWAFQMSPVGGAVGSAGKGVASALENGVVNPRAIASKFPNDFRLFSKLAFT